MLMNRIEFWAMNNPLRAAVQKRYEAPRLKALSRSKPESILEIGCGQGVGAKILYGMFDPQRYVGIDLDPGMIKRARLKGMGLANAEFMQGDASELPFDDSSFDLVVDFGIIHHIPNWRDALSEVHRTLTPAGEFLFEELSVETWQRGIGKPLKPILEHPYDEMFSKQEFVDELRKLGFETEIRDGSPLGLYYFRGCATKAGR